MPGKNRAFFFFAIENVVNHGGISGVLVGGNPAREIRFVQQVSRKARVARKPEGIFKRLRALEDEIGKDLDKLEVLLG